MGIRVPEVLLKGNHSEISDWRLKESIKKTKKIRPDLFEIYVKKNKEKMNTLEKFEKEHLKELESDKKLPTFSSGDTLKVHLKVKEEERKNTNI